MLDIIRDRLVELGLEAGTAGSLSKAVAFVAVLLLGLLADRAARQILLRWISILVSRTTSSWDDTFHEHHVFHRVAHIAPAVVVYLLTPVALEGSPRLILIVHHACLIYIIVLGILIVDSVLNAAHAIYNTTEVARDVPIKTFVQVFKLVLYIAGVIFVLSLLIGRTPIYLFSGLGAMTAVLMLIFKDAILGFVAGIQLAANRMVTPGDWIQMPRFGADGDVMEVALTTVKVRNWDKTITTIPTYALISDSFKNWRGMKEAGGRRIKRAVNIDMNTIRLCTPEMLERFRRVQYISDYIDRKEREVEEYNRQHGFDDASGVNGRRLTNIGTFRAYVIAYLRNHPMIRQDMTFLVRQLDPTEHGLPIEIYVFCKDIDWANYEAVQADIFDHILAVVPEFELRVYQSPAGSDFRRLSESG
jgi:miniconductance mechanosensitive channel